MNIKSILTHTIAALLTIIPTALAAPTKQITLMTKLVYPNGKPATDAVVILDLVNQKTNAITATTYKPDATGMISLTLDRSLFMTSAPVIYISSPTGVGFGRWSGDLINLNNSTVEPYTSIRVQVIDYTGKPIAHAPITPARFRMDHIYGSWNKAIPGGWTQTTDATGYATFTKLPQGFNVLFDIDDPDYASPDSKYTIQLANAANTPDAVLQLNVGAKISGTVVYGPTNTPLAGALVTASMTNGDRDGSSAITNSTGAYTITRLNPGSYDVTVGNASDILKDWISPSKTVPVTTGQLVTGIRIALIHGGIVTGKIVDKDTGKGVPNVAVSATSANGGYYGTTSDTNGAYTFRVAPGTYYLRLNNNMSENQDEQYRNFQIQDGETQTYDFHVNAPSIVHGVVLGPDGKPVAGADVTTTAIENGPQNLKTDAQGRFTFDSPGLPRNVNILARSGNLAVATPFVYTGDDNITLHLAANALINVSGEVTDSGGQPIQNAKLNLVLWGTNEGAYIAKSTTDAHGHYIFPGAYANSRYSVDSSLDNYTQAYTPTLLTTATGPIFQMPTIIMKAASGFIGGTLLDVKSNPIVGATISENSNTDNKTTTDASGHFMLKGLPSVPYDTVLTIQTTDGRTDYPQIEPDKTNVTLYMPSPVTGVVLDPDNKPVAGAKVDAKIGETGSQTIITDTDGHFTIDSPGLKPNAALIARTSTMATTSAVIYNGEDTLTLHVVPTTLCTISGKIVDSNGNPVPQAKVELYGEVQGVNGTMGDVQTDTNGQFTFPPLYAQAKYGLNVSKDGYGITQMQDIRTGTNPTLQIPVLTLPIADAIAGGTVVDYKGNPVAGATITDQDITNITATTDQSGHFTLQNVPRGKTEIYVQAPDGTSSDKDLISGRGDNIVYLDKPQAAK